MKKIMFSDRYGLNEAVMSGRKTMTRRIVNCPKSYKGIPVSGFVVGRNGLGDIITYLTDEDENMIDDSRLVPTWEPGEIVAVAQRYSTIPEYRDIPHFREHKGWDNKMYAEACFMPVKIRIKRVWLEHLQDISEDDILKEGIFKREVESKVEQMMGRNIYEFFDIEKGDSYISGNAKKVYATLIDKLSGKGTWDSNPFVWAYEFEVYDPK